MASAAARKPEGVGNLIGGEIDRVVEEVDGVQLDAAAAAAAAALLFLLR